MARIGAQGLLKCFGQHAAVDHVDLAIDSGEFVAVLGPSGCGKTTLLRLLAGFERADDGTLHFDGVVQAGPGVHLAPEQRGVGMVFQSYALWPHMSVARNVGYPLRVQRVARDEAERRIHAALAQVGMEAYADRRPADLSGGQRQRVALARCLVMSPRIVLFDEPLANLDVHLRESMQSEFRRFHGETAATIVYVTHDQAEAMALADRIVVMDNGVVQQVAPPRTLYAEPATAMVAGFVGRGMVLPVEVLGAPRDGDCAARMLGATVQMRAGHHVLPGPGKACVRPEGLRIDTPGETTIDGTVMEVIYRGPVSTVSVAPRDDPQLTIQVDVRDTPPAPGARIGLGIDDAWCLPN